MRKLKKLSLILLASAALLCGCTQSNIVSPSNGVVQGDGQPDLEVDKNINIDWQEVGKISGTSSWILTASSLITCWIWMPSMTPAAAGWLSCFP